MSKNLKITLITIIIISFGLFTANLVFSSFISNAWTGNTSGFFWRIIYPAFILGFFGVLSGGIYIIDSYIKELYISYIWKIVFTLSISIPVILLVTYFVLSPAQKIKYFEGITLKSCETEKPEFFWGDSWSSDRCYNYFKKCENIQGEFYQHHCYESTKDFYLEYEDCNIFKIYSQKQECQINIAKEKYDINFCKDVTYQNEDLNASWLKHLCVYKIVVDDPMERLLRSKSYKDKFKATYCEDFKGVKRDVCYSNTRWIGNCELMSSQIPWYKENCFKI